jgi:uncharacterized membrane-anchored protein
MPSLQDHPLRYQLANELHARPFPSMETPSRVVFLAIKRPTEAVSRDRSADVAHLIDLLDRHGAAHPQPGATHYSGQIGRYALKWEQHTEFVTYTAYWPGISTRAFDPQDADVFPQDWLERAPGQRITSALIRVKRRDEDITRELGDWFVAESLAVSNVLDGAAQMAGDFRIDPAGHVRFAVFADAETGDRRVGRIVQRICEIETYKTMSMLGFERARQLSAKIDRLDTALTKLMDKMTVGDTQADEMLQHLLQISAELESLVARSSFRFEGTRAYNAIVNQRIAVLRETHFHGRQTFAEFMLRRFEPAMRTVESSERRLQALADRAMRAADLLRTSVDVERSAQNQALLVSMDRRADLALRLQQTVEGLSVVAISYYAVSLAGYALYPAAETLGVSKGLLTAAITLPVIALVWMLVRRIRRKHE